MAGAGGGSGSGTSSGFSRRGVAQVSEIANPMIDRVLAKKAGISTALLGSWDEIAGADFADTTRPEKITWPRRDYGGSDGGYEPGVLTIACEGARALFLTHAQGELISRINTFFGFPAIRQIRIVQKPVSVAPRRSRKPPPLTGAAAARLEDLMDGVEEGPLREALKRLGTAVYSPNRPTGRSR
ncbi:DUF721 domain-containing protein [Gellertiella hungarica]|uniref:DUF721 domain-containing protein n=1 Tax=Gellertiella hungarica TaxID=1572859 RepID=A0A7W6J5U1_9HYPH|nr:DUF721 domain-containing protein [Gellertiella hungarica]MBB4064473.1 hypothetical protein [Gellertiella hungarica]